MSINLSVLTIAPRATSASPIDAFIKTYTSYLKFLVELPHVGPSKIAYPPAGGWQNTQTTAAQLRRIGKNDNILQLLRQLPQVTSFDTPVASSTIKQVDWRDGSNDLQELANAPDENLEDFVTNMSLLNPVGARLNADEVEITVSSEGETSLIFNCATGKVYDFNDDIFEAPADINDRQEPGPDQWRTLAPAQEPSDLFEAWRQKWLNLTWISDPHYYSGVQVAELEDEDEFNGARNIYQECGWPDNFRRDECVQRLGNYRN